MKKLIHIFFLFLVLTACEDVIELDVPEGPKKLVVDALLTNGDSLQEVILSTTADYFDSSPTPRVKNAVVFMVTGKGDSIYFNEDVNSQSYKVVYDMVDSTTSYVLHIVLASGEEYVSQEEYLNRVPPIESFVQSDEKEALPGPDEIEGYIGLLTTTEPEGSGDYYRWIIYINGVANNSPFDLIVNDDRLVDGNRIVDWDIVYDLQVNDTVEIHQMSISDRAYSYWTLIIDQITNFGSPFDTPPAPIEGNIYNVNDPDERVLGFFGVSKVEKASFVVVEK